MARQPVATTPTQRYQFESADRALDVSETLPGAVLWRAGVRVGRADQKLEVSGPIPVR